MADIQLPKHWTARKSRSRGDRLYYFNTKTGESVWHMPTQQTPANITECQIRTSTLMLSEMDDKGRQRRESISSNSSE